MANTDNANQTAANDFAPPAISLPKGGGAIRGIGEKFAANPVTGTGSMTVPIATSPGRSGFGPQLALSYDSGAGNGPFGLGWNLSLPSITRKTDKGLPRYQDDQESDTFILSGSEDLVPVLVEECGEWRRKPFQRSVEGVDYQVQRYRPRIEGLFARIERWVNLQTRETHWRSITRDNITTLYGKTAESRITDPADSTRVFSWLICESYDDKGNAIRYEYVAEDSAGVALKAHERNRTDQSRSADRYLKRIKYGNLPSRLVEPDLSKMHWLFEVVFDYGEGHYELLPEDQQGRQFVRAVKDQTSQWPARQDPFSSYRAAFEVRTYRLCQRVLMFHHFPEELGTDDYLVRSTEFNYKQSPLLSFITAVTQSGYVRRTDGTYLKKSLPPLEYEYSQAIIDERIQEIDAASLENLPYGLDGANYRWVDLDGEGLSGILTEQGNTWFYKENLGGGRFGAMQVVASKPSLAGLSSGPQQLLDLAGDGQLDLVQLSRTMPGFYERTQDQLWEPFTPFPSWPNISFDDPNVRFIDLTGDGHADVLITEHEALTWYPSLAEDGFGQAEKVRQAFEEERGPRVIFTDSTQSIFLADMSGDGLPDIVRIRNGEICYWPSLGYGRFGAKVTMDDAPWFDMSDIFDQRRVHLADIDGSGVSDIIYLANKGIQLYFNQSGNSWSASRSLPQFPRTDNLSLVTVVDLLGNGTACVVWSSTSPGYARRPMRYIDLMGGQKPHLMIETRNNMGAETHLQYAPSTKFYSADKLEGKPWITKLPFPVHVVERVETLDRISRNRFVTRYAYHHGFFDGIEREFRGFGMVEQIDTEEFASLSASGTLSDATNIDQASHVPPVLIKTWFHTGYWSQDDRLARHFEEEYYREPGLGKAQFSAQLLPDNILPCDLSAQEEREAHRALKGSILRQETYALDDVPQSSHPYVVSERNYTIKQLQPLSDNRFAVFFTHQRETIDYRYERNPVDPRISHALTLEVDAFGNVLRSAAIGYGRRRANASLTSEDQARQAATLIASTKNRFTSAVELDDDHRAPLLCDSATFELTGLKSDAGGRFDFNVVDSTLIDAAEIASEVQPSGGLQKRLLERTRSLYRRNNLDGALPLGQLESLALPFETYKQAFTPGLLRQVYQTRATDERLANDGRYVHSEGDENWWVASGRIFFLHDAAATGAHEFESARQHFFQPLRFDDPFGNATIVSYDAHDLMTTETREALGSTVRAENDYRLIKPRLVTDPNGNRTAAAFDALGLVVATAVMAKESESLGDSLEGFERDLEDATVTAHLQDPFATPHEILKRASTATVYDLHQYYRSSATGNPQPNVVCTLARETHDAELALGEQTLIQHSFSYSDGFGREIQKRIQAEPGPVSRPNANARIMVAADNQPELTPEDVRPRWVGSGWTVFNNKGKPVRRYEPFFADTHRFEFDVRIGVSPVLLYDPIERLVATLHPNQTWEKVVFDKWWQESWDVNDTVLINDPRTDANVGNFFRRLPDADYLPTWYTRRQGGTLGSHEAETARKASLHSNTPTVAQFDSLGRTFLTVAHNRLQRSDSGAAASSTDEFYATRVILDIKGNQLEITDANARVVMRYDYNLLGNRIHQSSMDAGERWMLNDVVGKPIYAWDSRSNQFRTTYDALRRPIGVYLQEGDRPESLVGRTVYGEGQPDAETHNLRGKVFEHYDQAGVITSDDYDFKSNSLASQRRLAQEYKTTLDWSIAVELEEKIYVAHTRYDALNRPTEQTMPDNSVIRSSYNEANLLERVDANLRGARAQDQPVWTPFINDINYNAKGQRTFIEYGNGVKTDYQYDPYTFRLVHLLTQRKEGAFASDCPTPSPAGWRGCQVQNLYYTYDPAGNVTYIRDDAQQTIYFRNKRVEPSADYSYDAIYQIIEARGREHLGQTGSEPHQPLPPDAFGFQSGLDHPGDGNAMGGYIERYVYDAVGNILAMQHRSNNPAHAGWTRAYAYNEASQLEDGRFNNRLSSTTGGATTETYRYDSAAGLHGNITSMPHLPLMQWDYRDQLHATTQQVVKNGGTPETTWYVYDGDGNRVRKVTERQAAAGQTPARRRERIYLLGFEIYREYENDGKTVSLERETLHVTADKQRIALVESRTDAASSEQLIRYHLKNHLFSASLELDGEANIISYEEFYPYGSTSYQAVNKNIRAAAKRYRYTGKERDEESGFHYHGARYYAPWLGRWTSVDPALLNAKEGQRLDQPYQYVGNRPLVAVDPDGRLFWIPIIFVVAIATCTIESDANAPTNAEQARNAKPAVTDFEFAARTGVLAATFMAGGGFTQSLLRSGSSKVVAYGAGGAVAGLGAPADLAVTDAFRGEMSSLSDYGWRTIYGVGGGAGLGAAFGGVSRIISGPAKLPTSSVGGRSFVGEGPPQFSPLETPTTIPENLDAGNYLFRGTTVGYPGSPSLQRIGVTPVSTDPAVATLFGTEASNFGEGVLLVSPQRGLPTGPGNVLAHIEAELSVELMPLEFAARAQSVSLSTARSALSEVGVSVPSTIPDKAALDAAIRNTPKLTSEQIADFVRKIFE